MTSWSLSDKAARSAPAPTSGQSLFWDATLPGFGLRVTARGVRAWIVQRRVGKRTLRQTIGRVGVVDYARAKRKAARLLGDTSNANETIRRAALLDEIESLLEGFSEATLERIREMLRRF